ncbi:MAG: citrate/2-methylcitrate synthase, partial [Ilumatobacter sp.]
RIAGFGHKVYRNRDPRFELLMERVRLIPDPRGRLKVVDDTIATSAALMSQHPNIDLAVGALTYVAGIPADAPLFAIARIAGWTAHHIEELGERPVRFRGLAH